MEQAQTDVSEHLTRVFGLTALRPEQAEAVTASLAGRDALVVLPTGYGKSLCFQLPAVTLARRGEGPTLVVSPLIALMDDQVAALQQRGVRAAALHSGVPWAAQRAALDCLQLHELIYVSPERLENASLRQRLGTIARVAVDEAHCISEWGHDFRPEYARLAWLKRELGVPVMALTATATARVRSDITRSLALDEPARIEGSTLRPNLRFQVALPVDATRTTWAAELLTARGFSSRKAEGRALVFAATRARAETMQKALRKAGIRAGYYHAGRRDSARQTAAQRFQEGTTPVLVATSAFGMGIDMPDVRVVLHVEAPGTLESYVQQAGRAGRDGLPAECWLAFSHADLRIHERLRASDRARAAEDFRLLADYALSDGCRQQIIARHLDSPAHDPCGTCDACSEPAEVAARVEAARASQRASAAKRQKQQEAALAVTLGAAERELIVAFVDALPKPLGRRYVAQALRGSKARALSKKGVQKNPHFGTLRGAPEEAIYAALDALLSEGLLVPKGRKYPTLWIAGKAVRPRDATRAKKSPREKSGLEAALRRFRRSEARRRRIKPYQVFQDKTLKALCSERPRTLDALREVWGIGEERSEKYGSALLELCALALAADGEADFAQGRRRRAQPG